MCRTCIPIYDGKSSYDPNRNIQNYTVSVQEKDDKLEVTFNIIFVKPIGENDIVIIAWDSNRNGLNSKIYDAWNITGNEYVIKDEPLFLLVEPEEIEEFVEDEKRLDILDKWAGYHSESASDSEILKTFGIEGNHIPQWVKKTFGVGIHKEQLTEENLRVVLEYLKQNDIVTWFLKTKCKFFCS